MTNKKLVVSLVMLTILVAIPQVYAVQVNISNRLLYGFNGNSAGAPGLSGWDFRSLTVAGAVPERSFVGSTQDGVPPGPPNPTDNTGTFTVDVNNVNPWNSDPHFLDANVNQAAVYFDGGNGLLTPTARQTGAYSQDLTVAVGSAVGGLNLNDTYRFTLSMYIRDDGDQVNFNEVGSGYISSRWRGPNDAGNAEKNVFLGLTNNPADFTGTAVLDGNAAANPGVADGSPNNGDWYTSFSASSTTSSTGGDNAMPYTLWTRQYDILYTGVENFHFLFGSVSAEPHFTLPKLDVINLSSPASVPEPSGAVLLLLGIGLGCVSRRIRRRSH